MQYYSAKLRLSGSPMNEVRDVFTAPQILIMQYIHGVDAIIEVKKTEIKKINLSEHKQLLKSMYDPALIKREQSVDKIFGALGQLPTSLPDELLERYDIVDEDDVVAVAKAATRNDKIAQAHHQPKSQIEADRLQTVIPAAEVDVNSIME
jgi:predicted Zn-dependent peptidase